jgi:hypothetical protein
MDPADSPSEVQRSPLESFGHDEILLLVLGKSGESPFRRVARILCPSDVRWTSKGCSGHLMDTEAKTSHSVVSAQSSGHWLEI